VLVVFGILLGAKIFATAIFVRGGGLENHGPALALAGEKKSAVPLASTTSAELEKRLKALKAREEALKKKEAELAPLRAEIESRMAELNELQARLTAYAKRLAEKEKALKDRKMAHLVALYSAMEPGKAAVIMGKLKLDSVVRILANMKGKTAGKILASMDPEKSARISERLSGDD